MCIFRHTLRIKYVHFDPLGRKGNKITGAYYCELKCQFCNKIKNKIYYPGSIKPKRWAEMCILFERIKKATYRVVPDFDPIIHSDKHIKKSKWKWNNKGEILNNLKKTSNDTKHIGTDVIKDNDSDHISIDENE